MCLIQIGILVAPTSLPPPNTGRSGGAREAWRSCLGGRRHQRRRGVWEGREVESVWSVSLTSLAAMLATWMEALAMDWVWLAAPEWIRRRRGRVTWFPLILMRSWSLKNRRKSQARCVCPYYPHLLHAKIMWSAHTQWRPRRKQSN